MLYLSSLPENFKKHSNWHLNLCMLLLESLSFICAPALLKKRDKVVATHKPWINSIHISPLNDYSNDCILHSNLLIIII
jgi:hypothetical protein